MRKHGCGGCVLKLRHGGRCSDGSGATWEVLTHAPDTCEHCKRRKKTYPGTVWRCDGTWYAWCERCWLMVDVGATTAAKADQALKEHKANHKKRRVVRRRK